VNPIFQKILLNFREINVLAELRNTILPKLISGELKIPNAEKFLEESGI
jgi:type I restriction enzyme S subunit